MFKNIYKITSYLDESRNDLKLDKRKRNYRFKNKIIYFLDQTILMKTKKMHLSFAFFYNKINYKYLYCNNYKQNYNKLYHKNKCPIITVFQNHDMFV
jgi:hypothetical protein